VRNKSRLRATQGPAICKLPGCNQQTFFDKQKGIFHDYCGRSHALQATVLEQQRQLREARKAGLCNLEECNEALQPDQETGLLAKYCCDGHRQLDEARVSNNSILTLTDE